MPEVSEVLRLGWGPGPGDRMLAPGLPDALFSDGAHLGWVTQDGAYALMEDAVHLISAPHPTGISISPGCWVLTHSRGKHTVVTRFNPRDPAPETWAFPVRSVAAGSAWAVLDHGTERRVVALDDGNTIPVPVGAADARPQPWADGPGLVWVEQGMIYRLGADGRVRVSGSLPQQPTEWRAGPGGSALFRLGADIWGMASGLGPRPIESVDWDDLRFSPSGERVLAATEQGVEERCLRTGQTLSTFEGQLSPVGFSPDPLFLEERTGRVRDSTGRVFAEGFNPSAAVRCGAHLYGPGGTAWDLKAGVQAWEHAALHAEHLAVVGDRLVAIGQDMRLYDLQGEPCGRLPLPVDLETEGSPIDVRTTAAGTLLVEMDDGFFELSLSGTRKALKSPPPLHGQATEPLRHSDPADAPRLTQLGPDEQPLRAWPLGSDGAALIDGTAWCWTEDGMLCGLEAAESSEPHGHLSSTRSEE